MLANGLGSVLGEGDFRRLLIATTIASLGSGMSPVVITFAVLDTLHSAADLGIVLAGGELPFVVFLLFGGVLADKVSRRLLMVLGCAGAGAVWLGLAVLMLLFTVNLAELVLITAAWGAISAITTPTMSGLLPQTVTPERLGNANALRGITQSATSIAGPGLAGVLIATTSPGIAVLAMAACYMSAAGIIAALRAGRQRGDAESGILSQLRAGWTEFRSRSWLAGSVTGFSLWHMLVYAQFMIVGALIAKQSFGGALAWSAIQACLSAGTLAGGFAALHLRPRRPVIAVMLATAVFSATLFALGVRAPLPLVCAACLISGVTVALSNVWWDVTVQANLPNEVLGRVSSYDYLGSAGLLPVGYMLAGPLAAVAGPAPVLIAGGVAGLIIPLSICALSSVQKLTSTPSPRLATAATTIGK
ncbi:MAG: MFS transporter [Streptosporangiaceae bacterium]